MDQPDSEPQVSSEPPSEEYWLLDELSEQARRKMDWVNKIREAQSVSDEPLERQLIQAAAKDLGCCPKTVTRMVNAVKEDGLIALVRESRSDKGKARYISEPWRKLVIELYKRGRKSGRRTNRNQIWGLIQGIINRIEVARNSSSDSLKDPFDGLAISLVSAKESHTSKLNKILKEIKEEVSSGELKPPRSHVSVYKIIRTDLEAKKKKARHPGQGPLKIIKTTDGDIEVNESNKVLQIDHTRLDILLVDQDGNEIGTPFLSVAVDSYSSCIAGFYLGFRQPSSLEVALVLRHAILPKHYGPEYELRETWNICGVPKYLVTDRAKEFKSQHLQQIAAHLGFNLRYRFMPEQGGIVESVFDKLNKEFNSRLPGYKGSNVQQRPKDAEKYACMTIEELERKLVRHFVDHVNWHDAPGVAEKRAERWEKMMLDPPRIPDERELDICLLKQNKRPKVQKYGTIQFENEIYQGECLLDYVTEKVVVRYDPSNIIHLLIYTYEENGQPGKFLGVVKARDRKEERLSLKELKEKQRRLREGVKALDNTSIHEERLALNQFSEEKVKQNRKQRRQKEHDRTGRSSGLSNVVKFKRQEEEAAKAASDGDSAPSIDPNLGRKRFKPSGAAKIAVSNWNEHLQDNW